MKLYGSLTSPYVRKVRMCFKEKGIDHEFIVEGPMDGAGNVPSVNCLPISVAFSTDKPASPTT